MGFFDKISKQAKTLANDVSAKASDIERDMTAKASEISETASAKAKELSEIVSAKGTEIMDSTPSADEISEWAKTVPDTIHEYADRFDTDEMWEKLKSTAAKVGQEMIVMVLTMYYTIEDSIKNLKKK